MTLHSKKFKRQLTLKNNKTIERNIWLTKQPYKKTLINKNPQKYYLKNTNAKTQTKTCIQLTYSIDIKTTPWTWPIDQIQILQTNQIWSTNQTYKILKYNIHNTTYKNSII